MSAPAATPKPKTYPLPKRSYDIVTSHFTMQVEAKSVLKALADFWARREGYFHGGQVPKDFEVHGAFESRCVVHQQPGGAPFVVTITCNRQSERPAEVALAW